jgi:hypothetical protein
MSTVTARRAAGDRVMRMFRPVFGALMACATIAPAIATTMQAMTVPDPIRAGATCTVNSISSYGSYIYDWPSKYDQVFWPQIDSDLVWFCPTSGFAAFVGDVDDITPAERDHIASWLADHYDAARDTTLASTWRLLEGSYALRKRDAEFRNRLLRVLAYVNETALMNPDAARGYRERALAEIRIALAGTLPPQTRLEYLFVAAAYARELGDEKESDGALAELDTALAPYRKAAGTKDEDTVDDDASEPSEEGDAAERLANYAEYIDELRGDVTRITPGGALAPPPATD